MPQPDSICAYPLPAPESLDDDLKIVFEKCVTKLGMVPNVLATYTMRPQRLRNFMAMYNEIMFSDSGLSKLEREMVAVVVSSVNRCYYCLVAHGQAVRALSGDPELGEMLVMNYRVARLEPRQRAMLDFAWKLTETPSLVGEDDRRVLHEAGFSAEDVFDLAETVAFYNFSNRLATALEMIPNREYHGMDRPEDFRKSGQSSR